jgi:DNA-binding XRE family transcriptional regulator
LLIGRFTRPQKGPIPDGMVADHLCRHTLCVNPNHLESVTSLEDLRRARVEVNVERLRALRGSCVFSRAMLADRARVSKSTIYNLEHGKTRANPSTLHRLAKALSVEPSELIA